VLFIQSAKTKYYALIFVHDMRTIFFSSKVDWAQGTKIENYRTVAAPDERKRKSTFIALLFDMIA